ncbi:GNAT family N-acetyltransferase [Bacillus cytotoxicus]|uniref:GNAT family N-acetyltransferase n=1 Tax=Bacillus cytotoxicus TaxID=580165 RepID=A0ACC6A8S8_9BACI|nr:GNAT family N-acetyltransferase [Bacillus cytotoxicus]
MNTCVQEIKTEQEFRKAFPVLQQLRPKLSLEEALSLLGKMKEENYRLFALYNSEWEVMSLAGVAICTNFYNKKHVFIYDLVTAEAHRSNGYGEKLLSYIEEWGKENDCSCVVLTSSFPRIDAHRFYEREGYKKVSYSFWKEIK